ncbi:MAG: ArsR family transcriptional regulator [Candidatus Hodarchaeales archaeon]
MELLAEIIHPTRIKMLKMLHDSPQTLAEISKKLELSKPEISRHLARLRDQRLADREEKVHKITNFGEILIRILAPIDFILEHYSYFTEHTLIDLPIHLVRELDALQNCELISGTGYIFSKMETLRRDNTQEVKMMVDQPFPDSRQAHCDKLYIIVPSIAKSENLQLKRIKQTSNYFEYRKLPAVNVSFGIVDQKFGFIFFPGLNGKIDYNHCFFVSDYLGIEFLLRLWDYYWENGEFLVSSDRPL